MAFARDSYTAASSQTDFTITFGYLNEDHVQVELNGTAQTVTTDYTLIGGGATVRFNSGLTTGDQVVITRLTSRGTRLVDYTVPGVLTESDLDTDSLQAFYMAQEAIDRASLSMGLDSTGNWDAVSLRIKNLANPSAAADAVTKSYVDALTITAGNVPTPSTPAEDDYTLRADSGVYSWQPGAPTPQDPADDGKFMRADSGLWVPVSPGTNGIPPVPVDVTNDNDTLVASGGEYTLGTLPVLGGGTGSTTVSGARSSLDVLRLGLIAGVVPVSDASRVSGESDRGKLITMTSQTAARTLTLPDPTAVPTNWHATFKKANTADFRVQIAVPNSETIDGHSALRLWHAGDQVTIASDGTNFHVLAAEIKPYVTVRSTGDTGTHTFQEGRNYVECIGCAGGGSGGGTDATAGSQASEGGGGGGGETIHGYWAIAGASASYQVGSGGTGTAGNGANGTNTQLTGYFAADRGNGGDDGTTARNQIADGGDGGSGHDTTDAIWSYSIPGGGGAAGVVRNFNNNAGSADISFVTMNAAGGGSAFAGPFMNMNNNANQSNSNAPGQGGAGAAANASESAKTGGDGDDGILIIKEYF